MSELPPNIVEAFKREVGLASIQECLASVLGDGTFGKGIWRFFSTSDARSWNAPKLWREAWDGLSSDLFFFGEDVWGNQLAIEVGSPSVRLWNHESAEIIDLLLDPVTLVEVVVQSGLSWIDYYSPTMLEIGESKVPDLPEQYHLHWTHPLNLGGQVSSQNTSVIERVTHLRGHAAIWRQIHALPPGTEIVIKPRKPN